nr:cell number regulator 11-like [Setaria viridis]
MSGEWSVGLGSCFGDVGTCCLTCWCPCVTFGRVAAVVDRGSTCRCSTLSLLFVHSYKPSISLADSYLFAACCMNGTLYVLLLSIGCQWVYTCSKRSSMRAQYNLQESPCLDCCVHFWCDTCALCQEYRELEKRGFNMAKGWEGSNKVVGCVEGMRPPRKQSMCF